jgi:hypothetical protein
MEGFPHRANFNAAPSVKPFFLPEINAANGAVPQPKTNQPNQSRVLAGVRRFKALDIYWALNPDVRFSRPVLEFRP